METKHIIALIILVMLTCGSMAVQVLWPRARDAAFFALTAGAVLAERMDVNFLGEYWYRGTSRGIQVSLIDVLAWGLLFATLVAPKYPRRSWLFPASTGLILLYFGYGIFSVTRAEQKMF